MVIVTGAGLSVASGIPTYRDHDGAWVRSEPIKGHDFRHSERARARYWARSGDTVSWRERFGVLNVAPGRDTTVELESAPDRRGPR